MTSTGTSVVASSAPQHSLVAQSRVEGVEERCQEAQQLLKELATLPLEKGRLKLQRKIEAEMRFLRRLLQHPDKIADKHLRCSNLSHLSALLKCALTTEGVVAVLKPFSYPSEQCNEADAFPEQIHLVVDVVADYGKMWIKVVARNPQALSVSALGIPGIEESALSPGKPMKLPQTSSRRKKAQQQQGGGNFGRRTILHQIEDLMQCAKHNPHMYSTPRIKILFGAGVTRHLKELLEQKGIEVEASHVEEDAEPPDSDDGEQDGNEENQQQAGNEPADRPRCNANGSTQRINETGEHPFCRVWNLDLLSVPQDAVLNLDVSTMVAYVSSLTNGRSHFVFEDKILAEQARRERRKPLKQELDRLFKGRQLVCCESARRDFQDIVKTVGGPKEKERAAELLKRVTVVPDRPSDRAKGLAVSGKIKPRSRTVFGTGDSLKAINVTANGGFLRAAEGQGVKFVAYVHESRALTETKEVTATPISADGSPVVTH